MCVSENVNEYEYGFQGKKQYQITLGVTLDNKQVTQEYKFCKQQHLKWNFYTSH